jgi:hypothetical protein
MEQSQLVAQGQVRSSHHIPDPEEGAGQDQDRTDDVHRCPFQPTLKAEK